MEHPKRGTGVLPWQSESAWRDQLLAESIGWVRDVKHVSGPELEAYKAGVTQGMGAILATLSFQGIIYRTYDDK